MSKSYTHEVIGLLWLILASLQDDGSRLAVFFAISGAWHLLTGFYYFIRTGK